MRTLTFCFFALCCTCIAVGQIDLEVNQSESELEIGINNSSDVSSIVGTGSLILTPLSKPFATAQLSELEIEFADGFQIALVPGLLFFEAAPGDVTISMLTPGNAGNVNEENQFDQNNNIVQFGGTISIVDPFNLFGGNMEFDLSLTPPVSLDLTGVQLSTLDSQINVSTAVSISLETPGGTLEATGNIILNGELNQTLLGDVNLDGQVNFLDVEPFVNLILTGGFQTEADINLDGEVDLLDVAPMSNLLSVGSN